MSLLVPDCTGWRQAALYCSLECASLCASQTASFLSAFSFERESSRKCRGPLHKSEARKTGGVKWP